MAVVLALQGYEFPLAFSNFCRASSSLPASTWTVADEIDAVVSHVVISFWWEVRENTAVMDLDNALSKCSASAKKPPCIEKV